MTCLELPLFIHIQKKKIFDSLPGPFEVPIILFCHAASAENKKKKSFASFQKLLAWHIQTGFFNFLCLQGVVNLSSI